ncbi:MAG: Flp pilus assembly protein CpaB [Isosphaeraceae bacterium]
MNGRSVGFLAFAVVLGLIAMLMSRLLLGSRAPSNDNESLDVLVANRDLKDEELLKLDMVKVTKIAKSAVPAGAFAAFKDVEDRWVKTAMLEGDPIIEKKLGPKGTPPGLVANIPPGMRAFALDVTEQSSVSGFILPGHHVDVIRYEQSDKHEPRGETILQNVLVLAAGQTFTRQEEKTVQSRTVTLALSPQEVITVVAARAKGNLSLSLRGVNDQTVVPKPAGDSEQERRWKSEEQRRIKLEQEIAELKQLLARKPVELPAPRTPPPARIATIYRGLPGSAGHVERVLVDQSAVTQLIDKAGLMARRTSGPAANALGPGSSAEELLDDETAP